jgi:arylsulfatase A-like enzyme
MAKQHLPYLTPEPFNMLAWTLLPILLQLLNPVLQAQGQGDTISSRQTSSTKPNIILILTDDQDVRTGTLDYMPKTRKAIAEQGTSYERFYAPVSLCCPSRVSLLRAQYAHNHNITFVDGPYGGDYRFFPYTPRRLIQSILLPGYHLFCEKGLNDAYLPVFLQEAGYNTYYTGKLVRRGSFPIQTIH